ncbi:hypothetical protein BAUCODRAFT_30434 [Baudoinia panamericana UAMH 10762]|uniref:DUF7785 domain-containing protein n=1 Tax=Baudoinia panamericana (strain UAMH 10762) TaxID=717646 RepID=M2LZA9_BAUPA|nr:uncharacterized protein BAUCODRAFT_30434 [Baudoinia panamericana UAMH 10762]EMC99997.1 hypothetical protein BAUCODRAFT_30434 [Baudoinia panamericana UAMH 10762]
MPAPLDDGKKGPTFEEAFAPPYSLPALHPPKPHKRSSTRDTSITWEFKDTISRGSKKGGYTVQSLTTGDWLGYGGVDAADGSSPRERRKQRDRALSGGADGTKERPDVSLLEEQQAAEEEALFRRAYSSFAPSHDNTKSVIPAETRSLLWWQKVGEQRFVETFAIDPALSDEYATTADAPTPVQHVDVSDDAAFGKVLDELDELEQDMLDVEPATSKTDVEAILRAISELLETLASHQRIRNATVSASSSGTRPPVSPAPVLASRMGKPDEPAEDEVHTYHALRRELAYLILRLPPYAVAKLDGNQLAELGVSRLIPIYAKDVRGTMDEDQVARQAKHNAIATAAGIASLTRGSSTSGQHYSSTASRTPAIGQAANTRYGASTQYTSSRTPSTAPQPQRPVSNQSTYGSGSTATGTAPRPTYNPQSTQSYTRPGATQYGGGGGGGGQQQYYQPSRPQTSHTPVNYGGYTQPRPASTTNYNTASASTQPQQQQQQQPRPYNPAANAAAYQSNLQQQQQQTTHRTASPANVQPRPIYQAPAQQQQQQQSGSGRATPTSTYAAVAPSQPPTPVNGYPRPAPTMAVAARGVSGTPQPQVNGV